MPLTVSPTHSPQDQVPVGGLAAGQYPTNSCTSLSITRPMILVRIGQNGPLADRTGSGSIGWARLVIPG